MRRISTTADRFEASKNEKITITIEAKKTPHQTTFSDEGPDFTTEATPPPVEIKSFKMESADTSFAIVYTFPPLPARDPAAHYLMTFAGKDGTSDGPNEIPPSPLGNNAAQFCEFVLAAAATKKAAVKKASAARKKAPAKKKVPAKKKGK
ncbi:MAG: hypothetical protein IT162_23580 [Bryobacterales bacterium]|nr:hypothetical protein [Bryobacterales bacterium]